MKKKSNANLTEATFFAELDQLVKKSCLEEKYAKIVADFYYNYKKAAPSSNYLGTFQTFIKLIEAHQKHPPLFNNYHQKIRSPFDYHQFGIDFIKPLINLVKSRLEGSQQLLKIRKQIENRENVVFLANHQTESDPQILSILMEESFSDLSEKMIFVAGERVITDPLAIPFSLGCDLLCIYSKKYIDHYVNLRRDRLLHNQKTMKKMHHLLQEGGKLIYVAPSGGRDRTDKQGNIEIAKFDPASIEMFYLIAKRSKTPTHFYPLTLHTYEILPPPKDTQKELGESRATKYSPVYACFGQEIDMQHFPGCDIKNKLENRQNRAEYIWTLVNEKYQELTKI